MTRRAADPWIDGLYGIAVNQPPKRNRKRGNDDPFVFDSEASYSFTDRDGDWWAYFGEDRGWWCIGSECDRDVIDGMSGYPEFREWEVATMNWGVTR